jgi:hypothetical protein
MQADIYRFVQRCRTGWSDIANRGDHAVVFVGERMRDLRADVKEDQTGPVAAAQAAHEVGRSALGDGQPRLHAPAGIQQQHHIKRRVRRGEHRHRLWHPFIEHREVLGPQSGHVPAVAIAHRHLEDDQVRAGAEDAGLRGREASAQYHRERETGARAPVREN